MNELVKSESASPGPEQSHGPTKKRKLPQALRDQPSRTTSPMPPSTLRDEVLPDEEPEAPFAPDGKLARLPTFVPSTDAGYFSTADVPSGRNYRYIPATRSSSYSPNRIESPECYRTVESPPTSVRVSWEDRSPFIRVTTDGLGLAGEKGYRSARLNVPVREGQWYFEVEMDSVGDGIPGNNSRDGAHVRLGWARREASLNGPAGLDGYSYAMRDKTGEKITLSRPRPYGRPFSTGDVVGLYISLPPARKADPDDQNDPARIATKRLPVPYKGQYYFESSEYLHSKEMMALADQGGPSPADSNAPDVAHPGKPASSPTKRSATVKNAPTDPANPRSKRPGAKTRIFKPPVDLLRPLPVLGDSSVSFFVNGEHQGTAFENIYSYLQLRKSSASDGRKAGQSVLKERENPFDDGTLGYYPFISLFGNAKVRINPGPDFKFPPPVDFGRADDGTHAWRPLCDRYGEYMAELWAIDDEQEILLRGIREAFEAATAEEADKERKRKEKSERKKTKEQERESSVAITAAASKPVDIGLTSMIGAGKIGMEDDPYDLSNFIQMASPPIPQPPTRQAPLSSSYLYSDQPPRDPYATYASRPPKSSKPPTNVPRLSFQVLSASTPQPASLSSAATTAATTIVDINPHRIQLPPSPELYPQSTSSHSAPVHPHYDPHQYHHYPHSPR